MTDTAPAACPGGLLAFGQQRMWLSNQLEPDSPVYNRAKVSRWRGELRLGALEHAMRQLLSRHEVLRTRFPLTLDGPVQQVEEPPGVRLPVHRLDPAPADERERHALAWSLREATRGFDLTRQVPFRAAVLRLDEREHWLVLVIHHIAFDRWSSRVLYRDLLELYAAAVEQRSPRLPPLQFQSRHYAAWQRSRLETPELARQLEYWIGRLRGAPPVVALPGRLPYAATQSFEGARVEVLIDARLSGRLTELARRHRATMFMMLLAGFEALLVRTTGARDLVVGAPAAGRLRREFEELIGCFTNTLVLRTDLSGDLTVRDALGRVRDTVLEALDSQELPFERLVEALHPTRNPSHHPIFQVLFNHSDGSREKAEVPGLEIEDLDVDHSAALVDLTLDFRTVAAGWRCRITYNTALFEETTVRDLGRQYLAVLEAAVEDPDQRLSALRGPLEGGAATSAQELLLQVDAMSDEEAARLLGQARSGEGPTHA